MNGDEVDKSALPEQHLGRHNLKWHKNTLHLCGRTMGLRLITPLDSDPVTLKQVKSFVGVDGTDGDALVTD